MPQRKIVHHPLEEVVTILQIFHFFIAAFLWQNCLLQKKRKEEIFLQKG
jgi:hypothetical protein